MAPPFNSKRASSEWTRLVDDLLAASSAGNNQSTSIEALKQRYEKLEVAINVAPSKIISGDFKQMAKKLDARMQSIEKGTDPKAQEKERKALRDSLRQMERQLVAAALRSQTTMGRALAKDAHARQKESQKEFARRVRESADETKRVLSKKLLEVSEQRGLSDSDGLRKLQEDLATSIKALRQDDFEKFEELSKSLDNLKDNYGVSDDTEEKLSSIEDLVKRDIERRRERNSKLDSFAENASSKVGLGGLYRGTRSVLRGASIAFRAAKRAKNTIARGARRGSSAIALKASRASKPGSSSILSKLFSKSSQERAATQDREDSSLLRRQVKALEGISQSSKGRKSSGSFNLKGMMAGLGKLGKLGAKFLLPLLGKLGLLGMSAFAGWKLGSFIYDKFASEIQDGIEVIVGVIKKGVDFASKGFEWFSNFLASPVENIKKLGGRLKAQWDNSVFAKFFDNPGELLRNGVEGMMSKYINPSIESGKSLVSKGIDQATGLAKSASVQASNLAEKSSAQVLSAVSSAKSSVQSGIEAGYNSLKEASGKLFKVGSNVNLDGLNPAVSKNFLEMVKEYKARGGTGMVQINSAYRSSEHQARLHAADPSKAAPPGRSSHERGLAIDINRAEANKMDSMGLLAKYGFSRPVRGEPWHLQAKGTANMLAEKGIYSSDSPRSQGTASSSRNSQENARPVSDSVNRNSTTASRPSNTPSQGSMVSKTEPVGNVFKGGVSSIPTHSYSDMGFFALNIRALG